MADVSLQILRRIAEVSHGPLSSEELLQSVGLEAGGARVPAERKLAPAGTYYDLLEKCHQGYDHGLPFRYGESILPDDFGAFGLALKTAPTVGGALERLARYVLVISDTLTYRLDGQGDGCQFELRGRPYEERLGIRLANECALAAVVSVLRKVASASVTPASVSFRHPPPSDDDAHRNFFGCEVRFGAAVDALHFEEAALNTPLRLGDAGLSAFLLEQLEQQREQRDAKSLLARVRSAVTDLLCDGAPRKSEVARRLGMSERTLHRHLAEEGQSFQGVVSQVRRDVAEALLLKTDQSLGEVAFLTGFSDQSAFQRAFKGWTGRTPLRFRQTAVSPLTG
jgi:AraC-like DNA-binding protein